MVQQILASPVVLTQQHLTCYRSLFVGRSDDFALQQPNGRYRRAGRPLTDEELYHHLAGHHTIGTYVIQETGYCTFAVFDADRDDGLEQLQAIQARLAHDGVCSTLELSRRPGHLWVALQQPLLASLLRHWLLPYCPPGVELYPKQDEGCGYGSLIRLPLGVHQRTGERYPFVRYEASTHRFVPFAPTFVTTMSTLETIVPRACVPETYQRAPLQDPRPQPPHQSLAKTSIARLSLSPQTIAAWCAMQDPLHVIGHYVRVSSRGRGCCPFGDHHEKGKDASPSFKVYTPTRVGGSCWYCYTAQQGGNVFDFLCRWYGVDAREMWRRIQVGDIR